MRELCDAPVNTGISQILDWWVFYVFLRRRTIIALFISLQNNLTGETHARFGRMIDAVLFCLFFFSLP